MSLHTLPAPAPSSFSYLLEFPIHLLLRTAGNQGYEPVEISQHTPPLGFTQFSDAGVIVLNGFAHHFALRDPQALGRILETDDGRMIQRKGNLRVGCHIDAILPYLSHKPEEVQLRVRVLRFRQSRLLLGVRPSHGNN